MTQSRHVFWRQAREKQRQPLGSELQGLTPEFEKIVARAR